MFQLLVFVQYTDIFLEASLYGRSLNYAIRNVFDEQRSCGCKALSVQFALNNQVSGRGLISEVVQWRSPKRV